MKLLLDEMISPRIARELRRQGFDVQAIKHDRPDLQGLSDRDIVDGLASEDRSIVTNDVRDYLEIHSALLGAGRLHAGMVFTTDEELPRNKDSISLWLESLARLLRAHRDDRWMRGRAIFLDAGG